MTQEAIKIEKVENCLTKKDKSLYLKVNGKYSVFEDNLYETLKNGIGKTYIMEIHTSTDGKWQNIRGVGEETDQAPEVVKIGEPAIEVKTKEVIKQVVKEDEIVLVRDKPNSRTYGKGNDQIKVYFSDAEDLEMQIEQLEKLNLMPKDWKDDNTSKNQIPN